MVVGIVVTMAVIKDMLFQGIANSGLTRAVMVAFIDAASVGIVASAEVVNAIACRRRSQRLSVLTAVLTDMETLFTQTRDVSVTVALAALSLGRCRSPEGVAGDGDSDHSEDEDGMFEEDDMEAARDTVRALRRLSAEGKLAPKARIQLLSQMIRTPGESMPG
ncbi:unnamed protein product, partial [Prorocentrum cordatum]